MTTAEPRFNYPFFEYQQTGLEMFFRRKKSILDVPKDLWDGCCYPL